MRLKDALPSRQGALAAIEAALEAEGFRLESAEGGVAEAQAAVDASRQYPRQNRVVDVAAAVAEAREAEQRQTAAAAAAAGAAAAS